MKTSNEQQRKKRNDDVWLFFPVYGAEERVASIGRKFFN